MDYTIEKSDISNLPDIAKLNQEIFSGMYENEPYNLKDFQNKLQDKKPLILVAKHNDTLIGFSISFPRNDSFYIWILGVLD
jgi:ribosomal protein S18 acetylase RimI-like enzyme